MTTTISKPSPWQYRENTSDFGVDTSTLLVANESSSVNFHHTPSNLREVGKELGSKSSQPNYFTTREMPRCASQAAPFCARQI